MRTIPTVDDFGAAPKGKSLHLAMGIFDGVHSGHQAVIGSAVTAARQQGGLSGLLTFHPHPSRILRPDEATKLLLPIELKRRLLAQTGLDFIICKPFTLDFASCTAADFLETLREQLPLLKSLHVGANFRFGKNRDGDLSFIEAYARKLGIHVLSVERLRYDGAPISSSRIRIELAEGRIDQVNALLGYRYFSEAPVVSGRQLGRQLGFPTLNLYWAPEALPRFGVYAVQVRVGDGLLLPAVANYGLRPTVNTLETPLLEVHLLGDSCPFSEGDVLTVEWVHFIRPERKFDSLEALKSQIANDVEAARGLLKE